MKIPSAQNSHSYVWTLLAVSIAWTVYLSVIWVSDIRVPTTLLQRVSWDEYQFLPHLHALQEHLLSGNWRSFFSTPDPFGYGDLFWQIYAAASLPVAALVATDDSSPLLFLRYVTLSFQLGCMLLGIKLVRLLAPKETANTCSHLFLLLVAFAPGLMLVYKPFSPDYLATFLLLAGLVLAIQAYTKSRAKSVAITWVGAVLTGAAIATKAYNALLLPLFILSVWGFRVSPFNRWPQTLLAFVGGATGFIISNTSIFTTGTDAFVGKYARLSALMNADTHPHAIKPAGLLNRLIAWWDNPNSTSLVGINTAGISHEFVSLPGLIVLTILVSLAIQTNWRESKTKAQTAFLLSGFTSVLATMAATNRVWTWYLICPALITAIACASSVGSWNSNKWRKAIVASAFAIHLFSMVRPWSHKFTSFIANRAISINEFQTYYHQVIKPYRPLLETLPKGAVLAQYGAPIEPIGHNLLWSEELRAFITAETKVISVRGVTEADRKHFITLKFTERNFTSGYSVFLSHGLLHPKS